MRILARYEKWLDEDPEIMRKIPLEEERLASFWVRRMQDTPFRMLLGIIGLIPVLLFVSGRGGPIIDKGIEGIIGSYVFFFLMMALAFFLGRKEKGHADIYPEMIVFYDYDLYTKKARPCCFYYWSDIVQYHWEQPYLWIKSKENRPIFAWIGMCELRPYLEQYAPHAEVVRFNMKRYFEERQK